MKCVFDNPRSGVASKANTDTFEEKMFHIIRLGRRLLLGSLRSS